MYLTRSCSFFHRYTSSDYRIALTHVLSTLVQAHSVFLVYRQNNFAVLACMIVTRMTHFASLLLCFELIGTNKLLLVCLCFKVFDIPGPKPLKFQDLFCTMKFSKFRRRQERQLYQYTRTLFYCQQVF